MFKYQPSSYSAQNIENGAQGNWKLFMKRNAKHRPAEYFILLFIKLLAMVADPYFVHILVQPDSRFFK